jgi:hypothetical protein
LVELAAQFFDQLGLVHTGGPRIVRLQCQEELVAVRAIRIGARIVTAGLGRNELNLRVLLDNVSDLTCDLRRLVQRDARRQHRADPDDAFIEIRQEFDTQCARQTKSRDDHRAGNTEDDQGTAQRPAEYALVPFGKPGKNRIFPTLGSVPEQIGGQHWNQRQRQQHRAKQCVTDRERHGRE